MSFNKFAYLKALHGQKFPSDKHYRVLVTLLDYADQDGGSAHPGNALLAGDCQCHEQTVKSILKWLKFKGFIVLVKRGSRHGGASIWKFPETGKGSAHTTFTTEVKVQSGPVSAEGKGTAQTVRHQIITRDAVKQASLEELEEQSLHTPSGVGGGDLRFAAGESGGIEVAASQEGLGAVPSGSQMVSRAHVPPKHSRSNNCLGCRTSGRTHTKGCPNDPWGSDGDRDF